MKRKIQGHMFIVLFAFVLVACTQEQPAESDKTNVSISLTEEITQTTKDESDALNPISNHLLDYSKQIDEGKSVDQIFKLMALEVLDI